MVDEQTQMFYVLILPKYYLANRTAYHFNIEGKATLKQNDKIVLGSNKNVEIRYQSEYVLVGSIHHQINLNKKQQLLFYRPENEEDHLRNQKPILHIENIKIINIES